MNYKDLNIKISYHSQGSENIVDAFINPALHCTKTYQRSVGFFASSVLSSLLDGIEALTKNKGIIQLISSPRLSQEDVDAINLGYQEKEKIVNDCFSRTFEEELEKLADDKLVLLAKLVASGALDIKIALTDLRYGNGMYHDKFGILEDFDGNRVVFYGSPNASRSGYEENFEKIRVVKSWVPGQIESVMDEVQEFESLWFDYNEYASVYSYQETAKKKLFQILDRKGLSAGADSGGDGEYGEPDPQTGIRLRKYQKKAIDAWIANNYHGFFVMATGTGKTWTAIYATREITQKEDILLVICAPYKHLIKQWAEDIEKVYPDNEIILISSENTKWRTQFADALLNSKYGNGGTVIAISTILSFNSDDFKKIAGRTNMKRMLIVDEAHRFTNRDDHLLTYYNYLLGLSATPSNKSNDEKGKQLTDYFGGEVFNLPIEYAIHNNYLVHYNYHPIFVNSTEEEEKQFKNYSARIAACWRNNKCIDPEECARQLRNRLRVIAMSQEKMDQFHAILEHVRENKHFIIYCGDGKVFSDSGDEKRHIQYVKDLLTKEGYKTSQFTAKENMKTRMELVTSFNKGIIDCLVAIRCLDEGINIPSIEGALILASNDDYREFVQRRGRILRTYYDEYEENRKRIANIYDVIVLPSIEMDGWAKIELRRYYEYARLADNADVLMDTLNGLLEEYSITLDDIANNDMESEGELDE